MEDSSLTLNVTTLITDADKHVAFCAIVVHFRWWLTAKIGLATLFSRAGDDHMKSRWAKYCFRLFSSATSEKQQTNLCPRAVFSTNFCFACSKRKSDTCTLTDVFFSCTNFVCANVIKRLFVVILKYLKKCKWHFVRGWRKVKVRKNIKFCCCTRVPEKKQQLHSTRIFSNLDEAWSHDWGPSFGKKWKLCCHFLSYLSASLQT